MNTRIRLLDQLHPTLPSHYYYDAEHHQTELRRIWYRQWLCAGRSETIPATGDYRVVAVGDQSIVITRDANARLRAFHNTCRHRGSILCEQDSGKFRSRRIVCPYHAFTYSLTGELVATPWRVEGAQLDASKLSLYRVAVGEWGGFMFINLDPDAGEFDETALGAIPSRFASWRLADTVAAHTMVTELACNWKVFWENFSECYHCPGVHPELCRIVPIYGQGIASNNLPSMRHDTPPMAEGAVTWSVSGETSLPWFEGLSEAEQRAGQTFGVFHPSGYVVAHVDYARVVHMLPLGPERTELRVTWMFPAETLEHPDFSLEQAVELGELVVRQDGRACELNQKGLRSNRHESGLLVEQEIAVHEFHQWVRDRLEDPR